MVIDSRDPVLVLEQRIDFVEGIKNTAAMCNWKKKDVVELSHYINDQLIYIDNVLHTTYEETNDYELAEKAWEIHMEDLRRWLSLILGIKIKYI